MTDDAQTPVAAGRTGIPVEGHGGSGRGLRLRLRRRCRQGGADGLPAGGATAVGEEPEMAHPLEARGQDMQQEAPDQFFTTEGHHLTAVMIAVVLVAQVHRLAIEGTQVTVGEGDAVALAPQVVDDGVGAGQTGLGVEHPFTGPTRHRRRA